MLFLSLPCLEFEDDGRMDRHEHGWMMINLPDQLRGQVKLLKYVVHQAKGRTKYWISTRR